MDYDEPLFYHVIQYAANADRDVVDMVSGSPDWDPPSALRDGLHEYADAPPAAFQYAPSEGLPGLRGEIAARRNVSRDRVVVTNGAAEANYLALAGALDRDVGDEVVLTDPVYPYYPGKVQLLGGTPRKVPVAPDGSLDVDATLDAVTDDTAAIIVNTPNNPTGAVYDRESLAALADAAEAHDAVLVSDEVYDHFDLSGEFESALSVDSDRRVVVSAFSKTMAITGFRVGYAVLPEWMVDGAVTRHMLANVSGSRPAQAAVLEALRETDPSYYERRRDVLRERISAFTDALDAAGAEYVRPEGGFYVMARFEGFPGTMANVKRLVDEGGVAGMPGETFGAAREEWIRFSLTTDRVDEAAERLVEFFG